MTRPVSRDDLSPLPLEVAPRLLGALLETVVDAERVVVRLTEVEAYHGLGTGDRPDPGSHARSGPTARNATMWGEPGHLYVYLSHGIHSCVNVVCGPDGVAGGVLLRAGEVVEGAEIAERRRLARRGVVRAARDLARGPGRFGDAVGLRYPLHDGIDAVTGAERAGARARLLLPDAAPTVVATGPRVGVAGVAGTDLFPWRFWIDGDATVSPFRWGRGAAEAAARRVDPSAGSGQASRPC
ncbi:MULTISPECIES: DNA-3-methyladenine glycosylase [Microbacterium]|uniref:DNA-3-methyladenine glycosylase n=1 Tax=Microbacterium TaxID=33882 RepID=UPI00278A8BFA|nr:MULTISPECIES: DNA-3-methyladenine glycosylase [Microbacterium]MDQ1082177.1 DNA-3-methyladenine glycosylase [Microbacterium sp. SORGH_AS_0344]MDQ1169052.1 DNA-3-methyladenine glycosylase [Microbacterium proteolyticum]